MSKLLKQIGLALTALIIPTIGWSAEPVATWTEFTDTTATSFTDTDSNYTLETNGNTVETDGITVGETSGVKITPPSGLTHFTVVALVSNVGTPTNGASFAGFNSGNYNIRLKYNGANIIATYDTNSGTWGGSQAWSNNAGYNTIAVTFSRNANGTRMYVNGATSMNYNALRWGSNTTNTIILGSDGSSNAVPMKGMKVHQVQVYASELSAADVATASTTLLSSVFKECKSSISESSAFSSLTWTSGETELTTFPDDAMATLSVTGTPTLTLDNAVAMRSLTVAEGEADAKLTVAASDAVTDTALTATSTTINADTDVSGITASLGAVTISSGKTLTVGANTRFSVASNAGVLEYKDCVPADFDLNAVEATVRFTGTATGATNIKASNGIVEVAEGAKISVPHLRFLNTASNSDNVTLNVFGDLEVTSVCTTPYAQGATGGGHGANKGILFGHYKGTGVYNVTGNLVGEDTYLMTVFSAGTQAVNINGGMLRVRALVASNTNSVINLTNGGTLSLATWTSTQAIAQNYGHGTVTTYDCSLEGTKGWTNPQAVSFTDKVIGTTLDPTGETIAFAGTITDTATDGGAKIIVADSGDGTGIVDLSGATLPDTLNYTVNAGTLILPAGKEGNATVTDGTTLKLVLNAAQQINGYDASGVTGSVSFVKAGAVDTVLGETDGVSGNTYTPPTPTWAPTTSEQDWNDETGWTNIESGIPGADAAVIIDTSTLEEDITLTVPVTLSSITVKGNTTAITTVLFSESAAPAISIVGRVALKHAVITGSTITPLDNAMIISIVDENTTWTTNVTNLYPFGKKGAGTLTINTMLSGSHAVEVIEGTLELNTTNGPNGNCGSQYTICSGATLAVNNNTNQHNPIGGSTASIVNNGILAFTAGTDNNFYGPISGTGEMQVNAGATKLHATNTYSGGTEIAAGATLTISNSGALGTGTITGAGTLICYKLTTNEETSEVTKTAVIPTNTSGLTNDSGWKGIVELGGTMPTYCNFATYGNAKSTVRVNGSSGYTAQSGTNGTTMTTNLEIGEGGLTINNGNSGNLSIVNGNLSGTGPITMKTSAAPHLVFSNGTGTFAGNITISGGNANKAPGLIFGPASNANYTSNCYYVTLGTGDNVVTGHNPNGKISIAPNTTAKVTGTWTASQGVHVAGTIGGTGTIGSDTTSTNLTLANGATIDATAGTLTVKGGVTTAGTVTVTGATVGEPFLTYTGDAPENVGSIYQADGLYATALSFNGVTNISFVNITPPSVVEGVLSAEEAALAAQIVADALAITNPEMVISEIKNPGVPSVIEGYELDLTDNGDETYTATFTYDFGVSALTTKEVNEEMYVVVTVELGEGLEFAEGASVYLVDDAGATIYEAQSVTDATGDTPTFAPSGSTRYFLAPLTTPFKVKAKASK